MLTYHLLKSAGLNIGLGNIGKVLLASCYIRFLPLLGFSLTESWITNHIAIITNISPDHLDRAEYNYQNYINAKFGSQTQEMITSYM
jgi:UDP-N-acetylmuramoylalanine--D-glutamate ligase